MYSRYPWSLVILFFLALALAVASLPFVLGRLVGIETYVQVGSFSIPSCCYTNEIGISVSGGLILKSLSRGIYLMQTLHRLQPCVPPLRCVYILLFVLTAQIHWCHR